MPSNKKLSVQYLLNEQADGSQAKSSSLDQGRPHSAADSSTESDSRHAKKTESAHQSISNDDPGRRYRPSASSSTQISEPQNTLPSSSTPSSSRIRSFQCQFCEKKFHERGNLNKHISSVHFKEKPMICPELGCQKSFSFRDGLMRHISHVHRNERMYSCDMCQKSFKQASHLSKHRTTVHKDKL